MRAYLIAAAAAAAVAAPALAQGPMTVEGRTQGEFTEIVQFGDLSLPADGATLRSRVLNASSRVCSRAFSDSNTGGMLVRACTSGTYSDAKPAMERVLAMAATGKQLAATAIRIRFAR